MLCGKIPTVICGWAAARTGCGAGGGGGGGRGGGGLGRGGGRGGWEAAGAGLGSARVRAIRRDRDGHLWVATAHGLAVDGGDGFVDYPLPPALCGSQIKVIADDAEGGLWLGTEGCGLHRLQDRRFRTYAAAQGLP